MWRRPVIAAAIALASAPAVLTQSGAPAPDRAPAVTVRRFAQNPLITVRSSASLGNNVNGATVVRVPRWVERPLGRYYMYFANHMGLFIRLAYANEVTG